MRFTDFPPEDCIRVDLRARDGAPVHLFVFIVSPTHAPGTHLQWISRIVALLVRAEDAYLAGQQARHELHVPAGGPWEPAGARA